MLENKIEAMEVHVLKAVQAMSRAAPGAARDKSGHLSVLRGRQVGRRGGGPGGGHQVPTEPSGYDPLSGSGGNHNNNKRHLVAVCVHNGAPLRAYIILKFDFILKRPVDTNRSDTAFRSHESEVI